MHNIYPCAKVGGGGLCGEGPGHKKKITFFEAREKSHNPNTIRVKIKFKKYN